MSDEIENRMDPDTRYTEHIFSSYLVKLNEVISTLNVDHKRKKLTIYLIARLGLDDFD